MDQVAADDAVPNDWTKRARKSEVGGRCQAKKEDASRVEEAPPDFQRRPQISLFFPANVRFLSPPSLSRRPPLLGRNFSRFTISFARASRSIVTSHWYEPRGKKKVELVANKVSCSIPPPFLNFTCKEILLKVSLPLKKYRGVKKFPEHNFLIIPLDVVQLVLFRNKFSNK